MTLARRLVRIQRLVPNHLHVLQQLSADWTWHLVLPSLLCFLLPLSPARIPSLWSGPFLWLLPCQIRCPTHVESFYQLLQLARNLHDLYPWMIQCQLTVSRDSRQHCEKDFDQSTIHKIFGSLCNLELFLTSQFCHVSRWFLPIHLEVESLYHGLKPFVKGSMPTYDGWKSCNIMVNVIIGTAPLGGWGALGLFC